MGEMMLKKMGNDTGSKYAGMKVSLILTRRWFYHAVSVFLQSVLLLIVAYTTFYYRIDNFQVTTLVGNELLKQELPIVSSSSSTLEEPPFTFTM